MVIPYDPLVAPKDQSHRVEYFELLFDLVYVFTLIQITRTIAYDGTVTGLVHGLVVLALVWWVWVAFTSLANLGPPPPPSRDWRQPLFAVAMGLLLFIALSVPEAFWRDSKLFAFSYLGLATLALGGQLLLYRTDPLALRAMIRMSAVAFILPIALVVSSFIDSTAASVVLLAIGLGAAVLAPFASGLSVWRISTSHLAERYALFMIITMGETIISLGEGASKATMSVVLATAVLLSLALIVILWRHYSTEVLRSGEAHLHALRGAARVRFARLGYTYLHLLMVAGLILAAVALKSAMVDVTTPLKDLLEALLAAGVAVFLTATAVFTTLAGRSARRLTLIAIGALFILTAVGPALPTLILITLVVAAAAIGVDPRSLGRRAASDEPALDP